MFAFLLFYFTFVFALNMLLPAFFNAQLCEGENDMKKCFAEKNNHQILSGEKIRLWSIFFIYFMLFFLYLQ